MDLSIYTHHVFCRKICVKVQKVERNSNSKWVSREDCSKNRPWRWAAILTLPAALQNSGHSCAETSHMPHLAEMEILLLLFIYPDLKCVWWSVHSKKHEEYLQIVDMILYNLKYLVLSYSLEDLPKKSLVLVINVVSQSEMKHRLNYLGIWTALLSKVKALHDQLKTF